MASVLALSWSASGADAASAIIAAAERAGMACVSSRPRGWIGVRGPRAPRLHDLHGGLLVLGDLFDGPSAPLTGRSEARRPSARGGRLDRVRSLARTRWGRYVALDRDGDGTLRAAFRDPSGAHELVSWRSASVVVVSTQTPDWLMAAAPAPVRVDWARIPGLFTDALSGLTQPPLEGLDVLDAGEMIDLDDGRREQVWRPFANVEPDLWNERVARDGLRDRVRHCVLTLASVVAAPGAELSGGLDSSIVAAALGEHRGRVGVWLNAWSARPETDERLYAQAVAGHFGITLTACQRLEQALEADVLSRTSGGVRPGYNGADPTFDALIAEACRSSGVDGLFTGKGGDALFFQGLSGAVFRDHWKARGPLALVSPGLVGVARWTRKSVWSVLGGAWSWRPPATPVSGEVDILSEAPDGRSPDLHPWLTGAHGLGRAKALQLEALTSNLAYATACRRTEVVDLIHPLLAQPLVEWVMRIPAPVLTGGRMDRYLARAAFAPGLPPAVAWRRSKGDYTATFEREAAASLPFLRAHLLDGLLAREGVIDRVKTGALLDRDRLMWAGGGSTLTNAALVESWVRCWTARSSSEPTSAVQADPDRSSPAAR